MIGRLFTGIAAASLVGVGWALVELWKLRQGGVPLPPRELAETLVLFGALGVAFAAPAIALSLLPAVQRRWPRASAALPGFAAALAFVFVLVNVRWLPRLYAPTSLLADAGMALAALLSLALFARRPWRQRGDRALLLAMLVGVAAFWLATEPAPKAAPAPVAQAGSGVRPPDVFLILVDTLRADHLGTYGYARPVSPRIDALAAEGVLMERAFSSTNWTRPAVASLFTSTMPSRHSVTRLDRAVPENLPLLAELLQSRGYQTGLVTVGTNVEPSDGYWRGADHFACLRTVHPANRTLLMSSFVLHFFPWTARLLPWSASDPDGASDPMLITERALDWVRDTDPERPVFTYLHYLGPHSPYRPAAAFDRFSQEPRDPSVEDPPAQWAGAGALSPEDTQRMIDLYDGEVLWNDDAIGRFLDGLRGAGRLDHAIVVLVADHGEGFGTNDVWGHNASGFGSVVRIPMLFWGSPSVKLAAGARPRVPASLIDVAPTLLELAGAPAPEAFDGHSLVAWLRGRPDADRDVFVENPNNDEIGVRTLEWDYFEGKTGDGFGRWLFAADDRAQSENLVEARPDVAEALRRRAAERRDQDASRASGAATIELDADRRRMLEELGYIEE